MSEKSDLYLKYVTEALTMKVESDFDELGMMAMTDGNRSITIEWDFESDTLKSLKAVDVYDGTPGKLTVSELMILTTFTNTPMINKDVFEMFGESSKVSSNLAINNTLGYVDWDDITNLFSTYVTENSIGLGEIVIEGELNDWGTYSKSLWLNIFKFSPEEYQDVGVTENNESKILEAIAKSMLEKLSVANTKYHLYCMKLSPVIVDAGGSLSRMVIINYSEVPVE